MDSNLEVKYGLPREVKFCTSCVVSNQIPISAVEYQHTKASTKTTIKLDDEAVCDACKAATQKKLSLPPEPGTRQS